MPVFSDDNPILRSLDRTRRTRRIFGLDEGPQFSTQPDPGLLGQIGSTAVSGLAAGANVLDLPGSSVRDIVGGQNPFDQWLTPFSDQNRLTGRDLNRRFGLSGYDDTWANWGGGFATEIALDPLTYLTFGAGALTKAGQVAKRAGQLGDIQRALGGMAPGNLSARLQGTLGDLLGSGGPEVRQALTEAAGSPQRLAQLTSEPLQAGLARFSVPFTDIGFDVGTGPAARAAAQRIDRVSGWIGKTAPARVAKSLFDPSVMGQVSETGQTAAREVYRARRLAGRKTSETIAGIVQPLRTVREAFEQSFGPEITARTSIGKQQDLELDESYLAYLGDSIDREEVLRAAATSDVPEIAEAMVGNVFDRFFRMVRETGGDIDRALVEFQLDPRKMTPQLRQEMRQLAVDMRRAARDTYLFNRIKGSKGGIFEDLGDTGLAPAMRHVERIARGRGEGSLSSIMRAFHTQPGHTIPRTEEIMHIPQEIVERMLVDPEIRGKVSVVKGRKGDTWKVQGFNLEKATQHIARQYQKYLARGTKLDEFGNQVPRWESIEKHAEALARWVAGHKPETLFETNNLRTFERYMRSANLANATYDAVHELVRRSLQQRMSNADLTRPIGQWMQEPLVFLPDAYRAAGMDVERSLDWLGMLTGKEVDNLKNLAIPLEVAQAITAARKIQADPEWFGAVGQIIDSANAAFKQAVTLPFPAFWSRNLTSGQYMNLVSGLIENMGDASAYGSAVQEVAGMIRGGIDQKLERELMAHGVFLQRSAFEGVELPQAFQPLGRVAPENPLALRQTAQQAAGWVAENPSLIDQLPGGQRLRQGYQTLLGTGAKMSQQVEFMNRVPMYLYLTRHKGWTPAAAAQKVWDLQIDYSDLAPFEKQVMRRLVPFYSFQRKIAPVILGVLAERPGGALSQTFRAANRASDADATTPDYVRETLSVPNPFKQPTDGTQSYWAGFGLPFEQLTQYIGSPREVGREVLSQTTPLVKAPLEWSTNQSFFQRGPAGAGRPLDELDPTIGRTISNLVGAKEPVQLPQGVEFLLANSPASRFLTSARQASDPRKSAIDKLLNAFSGVRVTDISPAAQDAVLRERAIEMMRDMDAAEFTRVYFRPEDKAAMDPQTRELALRLELLQSQLAQRAKDRKLKKAGTGQAGTQQAARIEFGR